MFPGASLQPFYVIYSFVLWIKCRESHSIVAKPKGDWGLAFHSTVFDMEQIHVANGRHCIMVFVVQECQMCSTPCMPSTCKLSH